MNVLFGEGTLNDVTYIKKAGYFPNNESHKQVDSYS